MAWPKRILLLSLALPIRVTQLPAQSANAVTLTHGIVGSVAATWPARLDPGNLLDDPHVVRVVLDLAAGPRDSGYIANHLTGSSVTLHDLEEAALIAPSGSRYRVAFNLFTRDDISLVRRVSETYAQSLASAYVARRETIDSLLRGYDLASVDRKAIAYFVVGCMSLDWDGLGLTLEKNYRSESAGKPPFGAWAEERGGLPLKQIYWGSHNRYYADVGLTSFGDHFTLPRNGFPDLAWRLNGAVRHADADSAVVPLAAQVVSDEVDALSRRVGLVMLGLRDGPQTAAALSRAAGLDSAETEDLFPLLVQIGYVRPEGDGYSATIPVLATRDNAMVKQLIELSRDVMTKWLAGNYARMQAGLQQLTTIRSGLPYAQAYTQIWHYLFGTTNRKLVEAGLFIDPYARERRYQGFVPAVFDPELLKLVKWH
jgi:hypothetical protein